MVVICDTVLATCGLIRQFEFTPTRSFTTWLVDYSECFLARPSSVMHFQQATNHSQIVVGFIFSFRGRPLFAFLPSISLPQVRPSVRF